MLKRKYCHFEEIFPWFDVHEVIKMISSGAACDENFVKMAIFPSQGSKADWLLGTTWCHITNQLCALTSHCDPKGKSKNFPRDKIYIPRMKQTLFWWRYPSREPSILQLSEILRLPCSYHAAVFLKFQIKYDWLFVRYWHLDEPWWGENRWVFTQINMADPSVWHEPDFANDQFLSISTVDRNSHAKDNPVLRLWDHIVFGMGIPNCGYTSGWVGTCSSIYNYFPWPCLQANWCATYRKLRHWSAGLSCLWRISTS